MNLTVITPARLPVSRIGLGCVTFGREIGEPAAMEILDHAAEQGVTLLDTAAAYGQGASESIIGRWVASRRPAPGSLTIATKILPPYTPERIAEAIGASMERLQVATIDLLYLHNWDPTAEEPAALAALDELVRAGSVRALGVSNYTQRQLETALCLQQERGWTRFSVVQNNHNLAVSDVSPAFRDFCAAQDVSIITYSPLGAGFLTGKHRKGVPAGSRFDLVPGHQDVYFHERAWQQLSLLESVAARTGHAQAHLALAWALSQPVASTLVGGRTTAHLEQALAALAFDDCALLAQLQDDESVSLGKELELSYP